MITIFTPLFHKSSHFNLETVLTSDPGQQLLQECQQSQQSQSFGRCLCSCDQRQPPTYQAFKSLTDRQAPETVEIKIHFTANKIIQQHCACLSNDLG